MEPAMKDHSAALEKLSALQALGDNVIYLMGFSFVLGSLFTILILIMLDFLRRHNHTTGN